MRSRARAKPGPAPGGARVLAVHVGKVADLPYRGGTIRSAFAKERASGPVEATPLGLAGDEHGDPDKHGGPDKAICVYPHEHYRALEQQLGRRVERPAFGENLTTSQLREGNVCIGDVLAIGDTVVQVSLPRSPCYRLAARHNVEDLAVWVERTGLSGFYLRVLTSGAIRVGDTVTLRDRLHEGLTVAEANRVMYRARQDDAAARRLLVDELGASWRRTLERRLAGVHEDPAGRRYGPDAEVFDDQPSPVAGLPRCA